MTAAPTISRIFADRYRREATRLEKLHANHLAPGTKTWGDAVSAIEQRMPKMKSPIKQSALLAKHGAYLREHQKDGMHFIIGSYNRKRSSALGFATVNFGPHPLMGVDEEGVSVLQHTINCRRDGSGWAVANRSLGYISRHAVERLHERGGDLSIETATKMFKCVGMLGFLMGYGGRHVDGGMCLHIEDMLAVGTVRIGVGSDDRAKGSSCIFYDVRTFLPVSELIDSGSKRQMLEQGSAATDALHEWIKSRRDAATSEALLEGIPALPWRENDFVMRTAVTA